MLSTRQIIALFPEIERRLQQETATLTKNATPWVGVHLKPDGTIVSARSQLSGLERLTIYISRKSLAVKRAAETSTVMSHEPRDWRSLGGAAPWQSLLLTLLEAGDIITRDAKGSNCARYVQRNGYVPKRQP